MISLLVPLTKIWATANLTGNWNNNDQKESHRKKRTSLCEVFLFSCVFKQIFQARQWQFRSRWGKTGLDLQHNHSSLVLIGVSRSHNNLTESDNFGCTKLRCWQLRALPQHAHDLKGLKAMQGYALTVAIHGNPWQSPSSPQTRTNVSSSLKHPPWPVKAVSFATCRDTQATHQSCLRKIWKLAPPPS